MHLKKNSFNLISFSLYQQAIPIYMEGYTQAADSSTHNNLMRFKMMDQPFNMLNQPGMAISICTFHKLPELLILTLVVSMKSFRVVLGVPWISHLSHRLNSTPLLRQITKILSSKSILLCTQQFNQTSC